MKKRSDFTLVELALVIVCLVWMLVIINGCDAAAMARASARKTDCINNKGILSKVMQIYANDNRDAMIYRGQKGSRNITYAEVLTGWDDSGFRAKHYAEPEMLKCSLTEGKIEDYTRVTGMLNAVDADKLSGDADVSGGWLDRSSAHKYSKVFGRFAVSENGKTVIYDIDKMKNPGGLLIFADTFRRGSRRGEPYWNFTPDGASNIDHYVTLIHGGQTTGAFADGHAEGMDPERLRECATEVTVFNDVNFNRDKNSSN